MYTNSLKEFIVGTRYLNAAITVICNTGGSINQRKYLPSIFMEVLTTIIGIQERGMQEAYITQLSYQSHRNRAMV